ncbi:MAG: DUF6209 family protein [Myxococcales bacterium]
MKRLILVGLLLSGCGVGAVETGEVQASTSDFLTGTATPATLTFDSAWNETAAAPIVAGGQIAIDYDAARLPNCRASHNGNPGWQVIANVMAMPSGQIVSKGIFDYAQTETGPDYHSWLHTIPVFDVPAGTSELQIWFENSSGFDHPCTEWDSDFGRNYRFSVVAAPSLGIMTFQSNWTNLVTGTVARGGTLLVTYAPERLKSIVDGASSNGYFAKYHCYGYGCCSHENFNQLHVRFYDHGDFASYTIGDPAVQLSIPADATRVELYFDTEVTTLVWFCQTPESKSGAGPDRFYDSNYGNNFVFAIP